MIMARKINYISTSEGSHCPMGTKRPSTENMTMISMELEYDRFTSTQMGEKYQFHILQLCNNQNFINHTSNMIVLLMSCVYSILVWLSSNSRGHL